MTAKELIKMLQTVDDDKEIFVIIPNNGDKHWVTSQLALEPITPNCNGEILGWLLKQTIPRIKM